MNIEFDWSERPFNAFLYAAGKKAGFPRLVLPLTRYSPYTGSGSSRTVEIAERAGWKLAVQALDTHELEQVMRALLAQQLDIEQREALA